MLRRNDIHFETLKKPALSCINFRTSRNKMTCKSTFCVTVHISTENPVVKLCLKNKYMDIKEFKSSLLSTSFYHTASPLFMFHFTIITSLKYKFVLCLLKKDERNRSVSVNNDIIKFFCVHRRSSYL